jgi:hypothetical protein
LRQQDKEAAVRRYEELQKTAEFLRAKKEQAEAAAALVTGFGTSESRLAAAVADFARPRFALVIGNGAYKTGPLPNPTRDARAVAEKLRNDCDFNKVGDSLR